MNDIDKVFMLQWIGPFLNLEELKQWENDNPLLKCNFYILTGKEFRKRTISHYVGMTEQDSVCIRLKNNHQHFGEICKELNIWIGRFSSKDNVTHDNISIVETLLISYWQPDLNKKKKAYFPYEFICLVNQWHKPNHVQLSNKIYPAQNVPDVIVYNNFTGGIWRADKLKKLL